MRSVGWGRRFGSDFDFEFQGDGSPSPFFDTITYFRHFYWYDPTNRGPRLDGYISRDTLGYAIELVRTRDSLRVAMLDSMGVMPRISPGVPSIHGTRPPLALVTYVVPPELNGEMAFLRLRLYDRGDGEYYFERYDRIGLGARRTLVDPNWVEYLRAWHDLLGSAP